MTLKNTPGHNFNCGPHQLEVCDQYTYLGILLKPSSTFSFAVDEQYAKASRAWFSISNIIYQNKKLPVKKAFRIFDSLITPITLYCCELWTPYLVRLASLSQAEDLLMNFGDFPPERLNQRLSRMILSVQKKSSSLAVLGETGRFPILINALTHTLKYEWHLQNLSKSNSLIGMAYSEMIGFSLAGKDCWLSRVKSIKSGLNISTDNCHKLTTASNRIKNQVRSMFERHWLDSIQQIRLNESGRDTNKLRLYKTFKGSFSEEPYISKVFNRNQRCALTRLRISAHHLQIEVGRYTKPTTPVEKRYCKYCHAEPRCLDTEFHFLFECSTFILKRQCFLGKISSLGITFENNLPENIQIAKILCPTSTQAAKCINKYILIMEKSRRLIDEGTPPEFLGHRNPSVVNEDLAHFSDSSLSLSSIGSDFLDSSFEV